jgi:hypothetical protein
VILWTQHAVGRDLVDNRVSSPIAPHSAIPLRERKRGVIPVLHTLYDYDKGIS